MKMCMEYWSNDIDKENRITRKKTRPNTSMSNGHLTWIDLGLHPRLLSESSTIDYLGHGTLSLKMKHESKK